MRIPAPLCLRRQESSLFRRLPIERRPPLIRPISLTVPTTPPSVENLGRTTSKKNLVRLVRFEIPDVLRIRFPYSQRKSRFTATIPRTRPIQPKIPTIPWKRSTIRIAVLRSAKRRQLSKSTTRVARLSRSQRQILKASPIRKVLIPLEASPIRKVLIPLEASPIRKVLIPLEASPIRKVLIPLKASPIRKHPRPLIRKFLAGLPDTKDLTLSSIEAAKQSRPYRLISEVQPLAKKRFVIERPLIRKPYIEPILPPIKKVSGLSNIKHLTTSTIEAAKLSQSLRPALNRSPSSGIAYRTRRIGFDAKIKIRTYQTSQTAQPPLSKAYTFQDVLSIATNPRPETLLIDVREPHEIRLTGRIPTALNIPIVSSPESLFLSDEEFEERLGFPKPELDKELVFYCKAGVRSRTAAGMAIDAGWTKVGEYGGSWMDWEKKGGAKKKDGGPTE